MRVSFRRLAQVVAVAMLTACSGLSGLKPPQVSVADLALTGGTLFEQRFKLKLRVTNPNDRDLVLDGLAFKLLVRDEPIARGVSNTSATIPRLGETVLEVEGTAQTLSLIRQLTEMAGSDGKLAYRIQGDAVTRDYGRIPFDRKGEMDLPWSGGGTRPPSERI